MTSYLIEIMAMEMKVKVKRNLRLAMLMKAKRDLKITTKLKVIKNYMRIVIKTLRMMQMAMDHQWDFYHNLFIRTQNYLGLLKQLRNILSLLLDRILSKFVITGQLSFSTCTT